MLNSALFASIIVAVIGALIFWSNSARNVNRAVFTCSCHLAAWLFFLHLAITLKPGLFWLRCASALGASVPLHFWFVKESIASESKGWLGAALNRLLGWIAISTLLTILPFTDYYIPSHSTAATRMVGWGYSAYIWCNLGLYIALLIDTFHTSKQLVAGRRLELQVWLVGGCLMVILIFTLMGLNALTHDRYYITLQPIVVLIFYAGAVIAITTHRIFDARQLLLFSLEKFILVTVTATAAYLLDLFLDTALPSPLGLFVTTAVALWVAVTLNRWLDRQFQFYPQANDARQAAFEAAQRERRARELEQALSHILEGWGQTDHVLILSGPKTTLTGGGVTLSGDDPVVGGMQQLGWATPERLVRERSTPGREAVARFLETNKLGVLVAAEGPTLSVFIGVGIPASRLPFTYPQVTQLVELGSIMGSALERAHLSAKVQHTEQLATVGLLGASLAHEIRNPLVTIKTFVQLLPRHYDDAAFRNKFFKLIGDEVGRIDALTEQLLDLASPRMYVPEIIELHSILHASLDLVAAKASHKNVQFLTEFEASPDHAYTDASAAKQVMLNLCFNAIQAVEAREGERWVKIGTRNTRVGIEMAVADSGPGIDPEIRTRLFQPFQTTKSTGFGLGLAICSDILANLNASITVDPPEPGRGATFRVIFPCQPLSS